MCNELLDEIYKIVMPGEYSIDPGPDTVENMKVDMAKIADLIESYWESQIVE